MSGPARAGNQELEGCVSCCVALVPQLPQATRTRTSLEREGAAEAWSEERTFEAESSKKGGLALICRCRVRLQGVPRASQNQWATWPKIADSHNMMCFGPNQGPFSGILGTNRRWSSHKDSSPHLPGPPPHFLFSATPPQLAALGTPLNLRGNQGHAF